MDAKQNMGKQEINGLYETVCADLGRTPGGAGGADGIVGVTLLTRIAKAYGWKDDAQRTAFRDYVASNGLGNISAVSGAYKRRDEKKAAKEYKAAA